MSVLMAENLMNPDIGPPQGNGLFASSRCDRVDLRIRVTQDKFDVPRFLSFFGNDTEETATAFVTCRTLTPELLDYHLHFHWSLSAAEIALFISLHAGVIDERDGEREPYAEQFMPWLGGFFINESAHSDLHAAFQYPLRERASRFLLPLKVQVSSDVDAEIDGVSMTFPTRVDGINGADVRQRMKSVVVDLVGDYRLAFESFSVKEEIARLSAFAMKLTEGRREEV